MSDRRLEEPMLGREDTSVASSPPFIWLELAREASSRESRCPLNGGIAAVVFGPFEELECAACIFLQQMLATKAHSDEA